MTTKQFALIAALDEKNGIGKDGGIPWRIKADMESFKLLTTRAVPGKLNAVIMGRKTFESLPPKFRPLPDRLNIVMTRDPSTERTPKTVNARTFEAALATASTDKIDLVYVIGGGQIYREAIAHPDCRSLVLTRVHGTFDCDTFFPEFEDRFSMASWTPAGEENGLAYTYQVFNRK